jgi:polysaccharide export outer membrane protein
MKKIYSTGILIIMLISSACVSHKKTIYIQEEGKKLPLKEFEIDRSITETIQPGDELYITVTTSDERPTNFSQAEIVGFDITLRSFTVSDDGSIRIPYLGKVDVLGKTLIELSEEIEEALGSFISTPSVLIKFVNKNITIIGDVESPGVYIFYDKNINLFQAIAHAGDISTFGNRRHVLLVREEDGKVIKYRLNLTDETILTSPLYIVKPGDIIYVEPLRIKKWGFETFPYTLLITLLNTVIVLYTFTLTLY